MSKHPVWYLPNRNPSITERIEDDQGNLVDLSGGVNFLMRPVGSSTPIVNAAASPLTPATAEDPNVKYDWSAADITAIGEGGQFLVWWRVTASGKTQDVFEALIEWRQHEPVQLAYIELEEFKSTAELTGTNFADPDIQTALVAASRGIDEIVGRRFYLDVDDTQVRYYSGSDVTHSRNSRWWDGFEYLPDPGWRLRVDDLVAIASLQTDNDGDGTFENTWVEGTDFVLESRNAQADARPYGEIRILRGSTFRFPYGSDSIKVTGQFGWSEVPAGVKQATTIIATRLLRRTREAPFGIVSIGVEGAAVRAASIARDPDINFLLEPYMRRRLFV